MALKSLFFLFTLSTLTLIASDVRVLQTGKEFLIIEYTPRYTDTSFSPLNPEMRDIRFLNMSVLNPMEFGLYPVSFRKLLIGLPSNQNPVAEILSTEFISLGGKLLPVPRTIKTDGRLSFEYAEAPAEILSTHPGFPKDQIISLGETTTLRDLNVQELFVYPVGRGSEGNIKLLKRIVVRITFRGVPAQLNEGYTDDLLDGVIINYQQAVSWMDKPMRFNKVLTPSVLATGKWVKFTVPQEGIYRITRSSLASYGIDASTVDPRTIKIYNNGGKVLPESNAADSPVDPQEIAIQIVGESDGKFDEGDYILFYARSVNFWEYNSQQKKYIRNIQPYTDNNFYFITSGGTPGKRMLSVSGADLPGAIPVTTSKAFKHLDEYKINIGKSGRNFMGDEFSEYAKTRTYMNRLEGYIPGSQIRYRYRFANSFSGGVRFQISESNQIFVDKIISGYGNSQYTFAQADTGNVLFSGSIQDGRSVLKFSYDSPGASAKGYLDFFEIHYDRSLSATDTDEILFFSPETPGTYEYQLNNFSTSAISVYDVSDFSDVRILTHPSYPSGGDFRFSSTVEPGVRKKYLAIHESRILTPQVTGEIKNQDIKSYSEGVRFIIITPDEFREQAERLSEYRANGSRFPITSKVFDVNEIFTEFGCGIRDISAIRNFIRYAMQNWSVKPEFVLLFGDGDYDYKNIEKANVNFIPPFQTEESFDEVGSYNADDYFGTTSPTSSYLQIPVGRIPVQNLKEAKNAVDKIIAYEKNDEQTLWRNLITLVADDGLTSTGNEGSLHTGQSETLSTLIPQSFDIKKIYLASYPTVLSSFGRRKPAVNDAIVNAVNEGTLILNYIGHGSPELWAHEQVFVKDVTIPQMVNKDFFFVTAATCDFGYFDKTNAQSSAEVLLHKENSGAIGVFTASRPVYSFFNAALNEKFFTGLLNPGRDNQGVPVTVGKAYFAAKSSSTIDNDRKFHLLGDPSLRLHIPVLTGSIDSVNSQSTASVVQIDALNSVRVKGTIKNFNGTPNTSFNGEGILTVYDSDRFAPIPEFGSNYTIRQQGGVIFKGKVSVVSGSFQASFVVPKDISYETRNGKVVLYFYDDDLDGLAFTKNIVVGGGGSPIPNDGQGPEVEIYFDSFENISGSLVRPNSTLLLKLSDETGINTTGLGLGHKMEATLNDNEAASIDLSEYFTGDLDSGGKTGIVQYPMNGMQQGKYKIQVSAWDVFNNNTREISYFEVGSESGTDVTEVYNYPNPFSSGTYFTLQHNYPEPVRVKIRVFTVAGRQVYSDEQVNLSDRFVRIPWDGRDNDGNLLANGTYLYKIIVSGMNGNGSREFLSKLSILK